MGWKCLKWGPHETCPLFAIKLLPMLGVKGPPPKIQSCNLHTFLVFIGNSKISVHFSVAHNCQSTCMMYPKWWGIFYSQMLDRECMGNWICTRSKVKKKKRKKIRHLVLMTRTVWVYFNIISGPSYLSNIWI